MAEEAIKLSEIKRLNINPGEVLVIKQKAEDIDMGTLERLGEELKCVIFVVDSWDDLKVIHKSKLKQDENQTENK